MADVQCSVGQRRTRVGFIRSDIHLGSLAAATVNMALESAEHEAELASSTAPAAAAGAAAGALEGDDGTDAAAAAAAGLFVREGSVLSVADFSTGEFTYAGWSQDMSDMKVRRWKGLMPVLSPGSELTTREMVRLELGLRG